MSICRTGQILVLAAGLLAGSGVFARQVTMPVLVNFEGELEKEDCLARYEAEAKSLRSVYEYPLVLGAEERAGSPGSLLRRRDITVKGVGLINFETKETGPLKVGEVEYLDWIYGDIKPLCRININYYPLAVEKLGR